MDHTRVGFSFLFFFLFTFRISLHQSAPFLTACLYLRAPFAHQPIPTPQQLRKEEGKEEEEEKNVFGATRSLKA